MILALTGGTGFVGRAVLEEARSRGMAAKALTRRAQSPAPGVEWIAGDLADERALASLVEGAAAVLHIAGLVTAPDAAAFTEANVCGTERLVAAARNAGAQRFVLVSSLAAREPGLSAYGRSKREGERTLEESGLDWTIVRPPAVYGPGDTQMLDLFRAARWRVMPLPPAGRLSLIHVADLARLLLALLPGGLGVSRTTFEPDDGREGGWSHAAFARAIGAALGTSVWPAPLPRPVLAAAARLDLLLRGKDAQLTPDRARYIAHPDWVCRAGAHPQDALWQARIDTERGLAATAAWYRAQGWL